MRFHESQWNVVIIKNGCNWCTYGKEKNIGSG